MRTRPLLSGRRRATDQPRRLILIAILLVSWSAAAQAVDLSPGENHTGLKVGWIAPGQVEIDNNDYNTDDAYSFGIFFDFPLGDHFHYGISTDFHRMEWLADQQVAGALGSKTLVDVGLNLKLFLAPSSGSFAVRPGFGIGFGSLRSLRSFSSSTYFTVRAGNEVIISLGDRIGLLQETAVWYTPSGSSDQSSIRIGPLLLLRIGIVY